MMLRRVSPPGFLSKIETSSDRSREFPETSCSSVADVSRQTGGPFLLRNCAGTLRSAADSRFTCSSLDAGCTRGLSSLSSSSSRVSAGHADFCSDRAKSYMFLRASRSLTQFWLVRKTRQVQHNMSHCRVLSWSKVQAKSWTCNVVSFWIQFDRNTHIFHVRTGE